MTIEYRPDSAPDNTKPYCLLNSDSSIADWFASHDAAVAAMRNTSKARYSYSEDLQFSLSPVESFQFSGDDGVWIEALEAKTYHTAGYGEVPITLDKLNNLATSVKKNVRGIDLATDYSHGKDVAKGGKASGTIKDAKVEADKLMLQVQFTDTAKAEIKAGEWKYFSSDWLDTYVHEDGSKHTDVLLGGGLTNRPIAKGLNPLPINFSEFFGEIDQQIQMSEDGMNELLKKLAEHFSIQFSEDTDPSDLESKVFAEIKSLADDNTKLTAEVEPLRELKKVADNQKSFAEMYPEQHAQMQADRAFRTEATSRQFSETIGSKRFSENVGKKDAEGNDVVVTTSKGLSGKALGKIQDTHKKFAEGTATIEDFSGTIESILNGGIVDYGESGTTGGAAITTPEDTVPAGDTATVRMAFAEKVTEIQETANKDKPTEQQITFEEALIKAATQYPNMYEAYVGSRSVA